MENENQKIESTETTIPAENTGDGNKPQTTSFVDRAVETAERLEQANKQTEELLNRQEQLFARQRLGGFSDAGVQAPQEKKETPEEYADKFRRGEVNPLEDDRTKQK